MAYTDDWENLMNGVFGPGGKLRFDTQKTPPEKPGLPDMNAALLEQQKKLDEMLKKQNAELRRDTTQEALAQSRKMLEDMEADGLLAKGTADTKPEHLGSFEGLATEVKKTVLGQDAFVDGVVRAMRRPFVLGTEGDGLADGTIAQCDHTVMIPMTHGVDSLNVAAAAAVAFYQLGLQCQ